MASKDDQELLVKRADMTLKMIKEIVDFRYKLGAALIAGNLAAGAAWITILKELDVAPGFFFKVSAGFLIVGILTAGLVAGITHASQYLAQDIVTAALSADTPPTQNAWISAAVGKAKHEPIEAWYLLASLVALILGLAGIGDAIANRPEKTPTEQASAVPPAGQSAPCLLRNRDRASRDVVFP